MALPFAGDVEFNKLLAGSDDVDLIELMLEFAADAPMMLDRAGCLARLSAWGVLAREAVDALGESPPAHAQLQAVSDILYGEMGLRGNRDAYYDPANSLLPVVVEKRTGIPITLGIVYMHVARRAGLAVYGVPAPGHFMLGCRGESQTWYVDPFEQGTVLDAAACRERIEQLFEAGTRLDKNWFRPATAAEIAIRVLRNLKGAYAREDRWRESLPVQQRLALLLPADACESRDLGLIYLRTRQPRQALPLLERYSAAGSAEESSAIEPYLRSARRMVAELN